MATNKNSRFFNELEQEINTQRSLIKEKYRNYDGKTNHATYDHGFLDGTLTGLKLARALWYKNFPDLKEGGDGT